MTLLQKRIAEFDKIKELAEQYKSVSEFAPPSRASMGVSEFAGEEPSARSALGTVPLVELSQLLQQILNSLNDGEASDASRLTYQDSVRAFSLIVRLATTGSADNITDVLEFVEGGSSGDGILPKLESLTIEPITDAPVVNQRLYLSLKEFWERIKIYLENMLKTADLPAKSRRNASQAYIKSLGFTKAFRGRLPEEFVTSADAQQAVDDDSTHFSRSGPGGGDDDDSSGDFGPFSPRRPTRGVVRREDSQHGYRGPGRASFDFDDRQRFGFASGEYPSGGRPTGFAGEDVIEYADEEGAAAAADEGNFGPEEEEGEEEFVADATGTIPTNAGPRLVSRRDPVTGEYDVAPSTKRKLRPAPTQAAPAVPSWLTRENLNKNKTTAQLRAFAEAVNSVFSGGLPDGKGAIRVSAYAKPANIKKNMIRRLGI
jgi:hypothetical protein